MRAGTVCTSQESSLALLWTLGIFTLNCGPVAMGFVLDFLGPKLTGILGAQCVSAGLILGCGLLLLLPLPPLRSCVLAAAGCPILPPPGPSMPAGVLLNMSALVLFGVSSSWGVNAFIPAAILLGLGNITFHLAQFHISALFPRSRGMVASVFVAGFTGCGIVMYLLMLIFESAGGTQCVGEGGGGRDAAQAPQRQRRQLTAPAGWPAGARCVLGLQGGKQASSSQSTNSPARPPAARRSAYRTILLCYAGVCSLWIPLLAWMMPSHSFRVGMVYLKRSDWTFEVRLRTGAGGLGGAARRAKAGWRRASENAVPGSLVAGKKARALL